ncbi:MAG: nucleotidyl transferase AbiEii/AbiGii toxin family protein [Nitrospira sp.]|nr:nucleotidyl transferase AbiEii/AbiGii toxin family protein [Nitrospira sp.]
MDGVAKALPRDRADLFQQAAAQLRPARSPVIIEKDFWVCWTLRRIFDIMRFQPQLIFKGGTSLSKAYQLIERFSEDVDLSLSRRDLGFADDRDPEKAGISKKESIRRLDALVAACQDAIRDKLLPELRKDFDRVIGTSGWNLALDPADPQTVIFTYPSSGLSGGSASYIRPAIRLEMGARSDDWPAEQRVVRPYAAEALPEVFGVAVSCSVNTMEAVRTFWEKATLLHAEYHRPAEKVSIERVSRHFYDLYRLSQHEIGRQALTRLELLDRVVTHKRLFFAAAWASYETARPGTFHLVPREDRLPALRRDYAEMRAMIFGEYPSWEEVLGGLRLLEQQINNQRQAGAERTA